MFGKNDSSESGVAKAGARGKVRQMLHASLGDFRGTSDALGTSLSDPGRARDAFGTRLGGASKFLHGFSATGATKAFHNSVNYLIGFKFEI